MGSSTLATLSPRTSVPYSSTTIPRSSATTSTWCSVGENAVSERTIEDRQSLELLSLLAAATASTADVSNWEREFTLRGLMAELGMDDVDMSEYLRSQSSEPVHEQPLSDLDVIKHRVTHFGKSSR